MRASHHCMSTANSHGASLTGNRHAQASSRRANACLRLCRRLSNYAHRAPFGFLCLNILINHVEFPTQHTRDGICQHISGRVGTFDILNSLAVSSTECKAALGNFTHMLAIVSNLHPRFSRAKACDTADTVDTRFRCRRSERRVTQGSVSTVNTVTHGSWRGLRQFSNSRPRLGRIQSFGRLPTSDCVGGKRWRECRRTFASRP